MAKVTELVGRASASAQVFFLTSHFLPKELYNVLLGSKCQMSRTHSRGSPEPEGVRGGWRLRAGSAKGAAVSLPFMALGNPGSSGHIHLCWNVCEATDSLDGEANKC